MYCLDNGRPPSVTYPSGQSISNFGPWCQSLLGETVYKDSMLAEAYSYDDNGNRLNENNVLRGVSRSYTNSVEDHILTAGADSYVFDVDGFLTSRIIASGANSGTTTFDYSSRGELLSVALPNSDVITYDHDPLGRKVAKRVNGTITEKYLWQDATTLLAVYDGSDILVQRFSYADGRMPVSMNYQAAVYYLTYDQVGSLRAVTDTTGAIIKRIDYDSFGNILTDSNPAFTVPFGFAGGLYDRDTGLVRFGARDYDPVIGKWTAKDPIDFGGGDLNIFEYVLGDPVNGVDPGGLASKLSDLELMKWALRSPENMALRTAVQVLDIVPIPHPVYQIPLEVASAFATALDIWVADVPWYNKAAASVLTVVGLAGGLQAIPTPPTVILGTLVDVSTFVSISYLLGSDPIESIKSLNKLIPKVDQCP